MKINMRRVFLIALAIHLCSCTENARARNWGGTTTVDVKAGQKVIGATWKDYDLWIIHRPMRDGEVPEVVTMTESSSFGYLKGHVVIRERAIKEAK